MAAQMQIRVVNALPGTYEPTTMYMVKSAEAGLMDMYLSSKDGLTVRHIINKSEINDMIVNALAGFNTATVVADIAARDALAPTVNTQALVLDASADATVASGAATYIFDINTDSWYKISESESMDVVLQWSNIVGRPTSSVADIDDAVARRHSHANLATLNKIDEENGFLKFDGAYVGVIDTPQW